MIYNTWNISIDKQYNLQGRMDYIFLSLKALMGQWTVLYQYITTAVIKLVGSISSENKRNIGRLKTLSKNILGFSKDLKNIIHSCCNIRKF
jgi:hypothetical protein